MQRHAERIAEDLEKRILTGALPDGMRLDETRLAEEFGVSRTPLREALQRLAQTGLVDLRPRRGAFVVQPGPVELLEMFEVMAELEATCSRLAARRISDEALEALRRLVAEGAEASDAGDYDAYFEANERFHQTIYAQSGNGFLEQEALRLYRRLSPFRRIQLRVRGRMGQSLAEHEGVVAALTAGDEERAAPLMRAHVAIQGEKFQVLLASLRQSAAE